MQSPSLPTIDQAVWHIAVNEKPEGPYNTEDLRRKFEDGSLTLEQSVWRPGQEKWAKGRDVPEMLAIKKAFDEEIQVKPRWHVAIEGKPVGPLSNNDIKEQLIKGDLDEKSQVWKQGYSDWKPIAAVSDLKGVLEQANFHRAVLTPPPLVAIPPIPQIPTVPPSPPPLKVDAAPFVPASQSKPRSTEKSFVSSPSQSKVQDFTQTNVSEHATINRLGQAIKSLYNTPKVSGAVDSVLKSLDRAYDQGNPFTLDAVIRTCNGFVSKAVDMGLVVSSSPKVKNCNSLILDLHTEAGHRVSNTLPVFVDPLRQSMNLMMPGNLSSLYPSGKVSPGA